MATDLRKLVTGYLEEAKLMQIATAKNNKPWVATVWFAYDSELNLYFISRRSRRHSIEINDNPNIAGAIAKPHDTLGVKTRGIQFEGKASEVPVLELPKAFRIFTKRFPKTTAYVKSVKDILKNITQQRFYRIKPSRIVLFDEINFPGNPQQELNLKE